jgi:hypothetical protein
MEFSLKDSRKFIVASTVVGTFDVEINLLRLLYEELKKVFLLPKKDLDN